ncbi:MAG: MerR family transcriptional regulator, partial [Eggerthellaceae bacterium]|nr:MerR family transcriptional regulator [Eggerthellaceae bacterium]
MLRIGEFSKMAMTTVKTLRHYDEIGLLKPRSVDRFTGYRLYEASQLTDLHLIRSRRQAGFSLSEVSDIVSGDDIRVALEKHVVDLQREIAARQDMLSRALFILEKS